jgi:hypothetical protein
MSRNRGQRQSEVALVREQRHWESAIFTAILSGAAGLLALTLHSADASRRRRQALMAGSTASVTHSEPHRFIQIIYSHGTDRRY